MKKHFLFSSICIIALCASLISGATFALFTSESKNNISITSGKVEMLSTVKNLETWSLEDDLSMPGRSDGTFTQGGSVSFLDNTLTINKIIPGDKVSFDISGTNNSNVTILYRILIKCLDEESLLLMDGLDVTINDETYKGLKSYVTSWQTLEEGNTFEDVHIEVILPKEAGNMYQDLESKLSVVVEAVQGNAGYSSEKEVELVNFWDGTSDYVSLTNNTDVTNKTVTISTAEELAAFRDNVNSGTTYEGYTVSLMCDVNLQEIPWTPIGINADSSNKFKGVFYGNNHEIVNLYVNQEAGYHGAGFFGALNGTVQDLIFSNAYVKNISSGSATTNGTAVVAGSIYPGGYITNVSVSSSSVNANRYVGGIAGYVYGEITNCTVTNSNIIAQMDNLTGSYDNGDKVGGIAGYVSSEGKFALSNNTVVNCYIEAERDVAGIAGTLGSMFNLENNTVKDTTIVYHSYKTYETAGLIVSQRIACDVPTSNTSMNTTISLVVNTVDNLREVLQNEEEVTLGSDILATAQQGGYSNCGIVINGNTLDGNGHEMYVTGANNTWDCAIFHQGGTIKNLTIGGSFRGIFTAGCNSDIIVENVVIDNVCYTFSSDGSNPNYSVYFKNSTLNGWTSYTGGYKSVTFEGCNFGKGTGSYQEAYLRPYNDSTFINCTFEEGFGFDSGRATSTLKNCYVGDQLVTDSNKIELLGVSAGNLIIEND